MGQKEPTERDTGAAGDRRMNKTILLATRNKDKLAEARSIFQDLDKGNSFKLLYLEDVPQVSIDFDVVEDGSTYEDNAVKKAVSYGDLAGIMTLADDSGLEVEALSGRPGIYSARYGPRDKKAKCRKLLAELEDVPEEKRGAKYVCVIALYNPTTGRLETFRGEYKGKIISEMRGEGGFGFDPIFMDNSLKITVAEMTNEQKNKLSHRRRALEKCFVKLSDYK